MEEYFERCTNGPPFKEREDMKYEFCRLLSFSNWPKDCPVFPLKLAKAGFYFNGHEDEVECFKCGTVKGNWLAFEEPCVIHRQLNPDCPLLLENNELNVPLSKRVACQEDSSLIQRLDSVIEEKETTCEERTSNPADFGETRHSEKSPIASGDVRTETVAGPEFSQPEFTTGSDESGFEGPDTKMLRSQSLGYVEGFSRNGLQNETLFERRASLCPDSHPRVDANLADSAIMLETTSSGSKQGTPRYDAISSSNMRSKDGRKKDKQGKKSKEKKYKKSSKTAAANISGSETSTTAQSEQDIPPPTGESIGPLRFERNRLQTFHNWPSNAYVPAAELVRCGFYYTGSGDRVQCIFCKGVLRNWEEGDRPHIEHRKHFPRCPLVLGLKIGNVPLPLDQNPLSASSLADRRPNLNTAANVADSTSNMENLGIITDRPKHPNYAIESQRLASFQSWPPYKHQTPKQLAEAGFWYAGFNDNVKCFYCDGGLRNWEPGDKPWKEHAHWFPKCPYVIQVKGQDFINNVLRENNLEVPAPINSLTLDADTPAREHSGGKYRIEEREIRARMDSPQIMKILDIGISRTVVMATLRKRLRETGDDFPSTTALMEAIYKEETEESKRQIQPESQDVTASENSTHNEDSSGSVKSTDGSTYLHVDQSPHSTEIEKQSDKSNSLEEANVENKDADKDTESSPQIHAQADDLMKENLELKEQRLCKICMAVDANVVFLPCGHLVSCASCAPALQQCPICRASIKGTVRTYIA